MATWYDTLEEAYEAEPRRRPPVHGGHSRQVDYWTRSASGGWEFDGRPWVLTFIPATGEFLAFEQREGLAGRAVVAGYANSVEAADKVMAGYRERGGSLADALRRVESPLPTP